jgi:hypothetical protein
MFTDVEDDSIILESGLAGQFGRCVPERPSARRRVTEWLRARRASRPARRVRRVVLLLAMLWIVSGFDVAFTLLGATIGRFVELNPIAAPLLDSPGLLIAFKVFMVGFASAVILTFRRRLITEIACWLTAAAYTILAGVWWAYYFLQQ